MMICRLRSRILSVSIVLTVAACAGYTAEVRAQAPQATTQSVPDSPHDIAGTWQGTLHAGNSDLRTVVKITKDEKGSYKAVFYSLDQGAQPINLDSISLLGSDVKFTLNMAGITYVGKLSADGKTIDGASQQNGNSLPLVLTRTTPETAWEIPKFSPPKPMAADVDPDFEVATIKPNNSGATSMQGLVIRGRNFITRASSLGDLISFAYEVQNKQIVNAPDWLDKERYDIDAVPEQEGVPNPEQIRAMIRKLLADRYGFKFHHEKRDMSAYVLTVGKDGQKLKPTQRGGNLPGIGIRPGTGGITLSMVNASIPDFTGFLQILVLDRPVVDKTGLPGRYDFQCTFTPDDSQFNGHPPQFPRQGSGEPNSTDTAAPAAPGLYEALQQELGLKLSAEKTAVDVIAIDHVQKPSPN